MDLQDAALCLFKVIPWFALLNPTAHISCITGARRSAGTLIKWRVFIDAKPNPARNDYFLMNEYGDPHFIF